jgi:hypothetical protein
MDTQLISMRDLAQRLLTLEAASQTTTDAPLHEAVRVLEKLRSSLSRFAGPDGYSALLGRALALARTDVPSLQTVKVGADGRLEGLEGLFTGADNAGADATTAVITQLLRLLMQFVGEPLTLRLVREAWPDAALGCKRYN